MVEDGNYKDVYRVMWVCWFWLLDKLISHTPPSALHAQCYIWPNRPSSNLYCLHGTVRFCTQHRPSPYQLILICFYILFSKLAFAVGLWPLMFSQALCLSLIQTFCLLFSAGLLPLCSSSLLPSLLCRPSAFSESVHFSPRPFAFLVSKPWELENLCWMWAGGAEIFGGLTGLIKRGARPPFPGAKWKGDV